MTDDDMPEIEHAEPVEVIDVDDEPTDPDAGEYAGAYESPDKGES